MNPRALEAAAKAHELEHFYPADGRMQITCVCGATFGSWDGLATHRVEAAVSAYLRVRLEDDEAVLACWADRYAAAGGPEPMSLAAERGRLARFLGVDEQTEPKETT